MLEPKTHDYTRKARRWGHDFANFRHTGGDTYLVVGWGHGLCAGDRMLLTLTGDDDVTRDVPLLICEVEYLRDPRDMWRAKLRYEGTP